MNVPAPVEAAPAIPKPPRVPLAWLGQADAAIALLVILLAGFVAAHISRNTDQWLHFAAGRDLLSGRYHLGSDPFSYLHEGKPWVNHSWLYDVAVSQLYAIDPAGRVVVAMKALLFAAAFGVVLSIRRRDTPAWPWWLMATVAVLAAAPQTWLRPSIISALFIAITLKILLTSDWRACSRRLPLGLAVLTALWANLDQWFFLGPAMVLMVLIAEIVQAKLLKSTDGNAIGHLAKAFALCLVATLLNPHFFAIWELPVELIGLSNVVQDDNALSLLALPTWAAAYYKRTDLGGNLNGAAYGVLLIGGGGLLALGLNRTRVTYLFLWLLFAGLALLYYRCVLFFAVAAVPLIATPLADIALRYASTSTSQLPQSLSAIGRILGIPALLALLACAWPGWLHPRGGDPALVNRVALGVEPDPGLARVSTLLEDWTANGKLPANSHIVPSSVELANHMAWFAPHQRVAVNSRLTHHSGDLAAFVKLRSALATSKVNFPEAFQALDGQMLVMNGVGLMRPIDLGTVLERTRDLKLQHLDGRTAVLSNAIPGPGFDPVPLAFALGQPPLPEPNLEEPDGVVRPVPAAALDAMVYQAYAHYLWDRAEQADHLHQFIGFALAGPAALLINDPKLSDAVIAANLLAQRAARQAMAANPNHPLAYSALAQCMIAADNPLPGFAPEEQEPIFAANARRFVTRMPPPGEIGSVADAYNLWRTAEMLAKYYYRNQMIDLGRDMMKISLNAHKRLLQLSQTDNASESPPIPPAALKAELEQIDKTIANVDKQFSAKLEGYSSTSGSPAPQRFNAALKSQLVGEAIKLLKTCDLDQEFKSDARRVELVEAQLQLKAGQIEDAVQTLKTLQEKVQKPAKDPQAHQANREVSQQLVGLITEAQRIGGDCTNYAKSLDQYQAPKQPLPPAVRERVRSALGSPQDINFRRSGLAYGALGGPIASILGNAVEQPPIDYWLYESNFYRRRALAALLDGQVAEAKSYFEKALAPEGIPLPAFLPERAVPERYLKMINSVK